MSRITLSAGVVSSEASLLGLQTAAFLLYDHVCELLVSLPVLIRIACEQLPSYCVTVCACELLLFLLLLIKTACRRLPSYCMIVCLCVCILLVSLVFVKAAGMLD